MDGLGNTSISFSFAGAVFRITPQELAAAASYSVPDYKRFSVTQASGIEAWV